MGKELGPTKEQLNRAKGNGCGPTFHPLHRNRVVCNQVPEWGRLTKRQAERIEHLCWPRHRVSQPVPLPPPFPLQPKIHPSWMADREYSLRPTIRSTW